MLINIKPLFQNGKRNGNAMEWNKQWEKVIRFRHPDYDPDRARKVNQFVHCPTSVVSTRNICTQRDKRRRAHWRKHIPPPLSEVNNRSHRVSKFWLILVLYKPLVVLNVWSIAGPLLVTVADLTAQSLESSKYCSQPHSPYRSKSHLYVLVSATATAIIANMYKLLISAECR